MNNWTFDGNFGNLPVDNKFSTAAGNMILGGNKVEAADKMHLTVDNLGDHKKIRLVYDFYKTGGFDENSEVCAYAEDKRIYKWEVD